MRGCGFPSNDHPSDKATFTFRITVPQGRTVVANGRLQSRTGNTFVWVEDSPMATYLATIDTGRWRYKRGKTPGGVPEEVAIEPKFARHGTLRHYFNVIGRIVDYESTVFGPYPFGSTGAIFDDARYRGERLGFSLETQTKPIYSGPIDDLDDRPRARASVVRRQRVGRSLGRHLAQRGLRHVRHVPVARPHAPAERPQVVHARLLDAAQLAVLEGRDRQPAAAKMFDYAVYSRGAMTLQALREKIGDAKFFALLKTGRDVQVRQRDHGAVHRARPADVRAGSRRVLQDLDLHPEEAQDLVTE